MATAATIQAKIYAGYAKAAKVLGEPFKVCRPQGAKDLTNLSQFLIGTLLMQFTNAKAAGFNFQKGQGFEDYLWNALADMTGLQPGDFFLGTGPTTQGALYFLAEVSAFTPCPAVLCNRRVSQHRRNSETGGNALPSQTGGSGHYFGASQTPQATSTGAGEQTLATNVPCALQALAGRARDTGEVPADAPGPARWRMYLPVSVFPFGSVRDRDIFVDDQGARYMVTADGWTSLGYKVELIRLEN